jgi:Zn-dependent protease
VTTWAIPVIAAITFHEAAHGFVAHLLGDDTSWRLGRVSFNPVKHIDPFGTIVLPGMLLLFHGHFFLATPSRCLSIFGPSARRDATWC